MNDFIASLSLPPHETIVLLMVTAVVAGLARGFSGFGAALIFVPIASVLIGPKMAAPLLLVTDGIVAAPMLWSNWQKADRREVFYMALGCLGGIPLGTVILSQLDSLTLRWLIVVFVAVLLLMLLSGWRYRGPQGPMVSTSVGALSGVCSGLAQIGGPPVVAYWLGLNREPATMRASTILFFAFGSVLGVISYSWGGLISRKILVLALLLLPGYAAAMVVGSRMFGLAAPKTFRQICFFLIGMALVISLPVWS